MSIILKIIGILVIGALGALIFNVFLMPYTLASVYFENFEFVKYFKEKSVVVSEQKQIYIQENTAIEEAIERVQKSIVAIKTASGIKSGLIITSDGLVVTLASIIPSNGDFSVFLAGEQVNFTIVKTDSKNNLVLLKLSKNNLPTMGFANVEKVKIGQRVFLTASLSSGNWMANEGIIRQINQEIIKTNIPENKNISGSPLLNVSGELIGINYIDAEGNVSAISASKVQELLDL